MLHALGKSLFCLILGKGEFWRQKSIFNANFGNSLIPQDPSETRLCDTPPADRIYWGHSWAQWATWLLWPLWSNRSDTTQPCTELLTGLKASISCFSNVSLHLERHHYAWRPQTNSGERFGRDSAGRWQPFIQMSRQPGIQTDRQTDDSEHRSPEHNWGKKKRPCLGEGNF